MPIPPLRALPHSCLLAAMLLACSGKAVRPETGLGGPTQDSAPRETGDTGGADTGARPSLGRLTFACEGSDWTVEARSAGELDRVRVSVWSFESDTVLWAQDLVRGEASWRAAPPEGVLDCEELAELAAVFTAWRSSALVDGDRWIPDRAGPMRSAGVSLGADDVALQAETDSGPATVRAALWDPIGEQAGGGVELGTGDGLTWTWSGPATDFYPAPASGTPVLFAFSARDDSGGRLDEDLPALWGTGER